MELSQKMEVEAKMILETEIDAGNADDVKLCIRMQTPKFVTKVKVWNRKAISTEVEKMACTWFGEICYCCS